MAKRWPFLRNNKDDDGPVVVPSPVLMERSETVDGRQSSEPESAEPASQYVDGPDFHEYDNQDHVGMGYLSEIGGQTEQESQNADLSRLEAPEITTDSSVMHAQSWLAVNGLAKSFGGRKVVSDVNLRVRQGEAVGLLGPNGAGKTTVFYMITGLLASDNGIIELDGNDITGLPMYRRARLGIGYLPQEASIFRGLTVEANIRAVLELVEPRRRLREEQLDALLEEFSITHIRKSPAIALSGGERRRVEIARALASKPSFMLLDEPFAGVDPIAIGDIRNLVRHLTGRGIGVLITDHNVRETLALIDRAYIIYSGSVLMEGEPDDIINSAEVRRLYLGDQFSL